MEFYLDTANLDEIRRLSEYLPIDGITTNPTILAREGKQIHQLLPDLLDLLGPDKIIHTQVLSRDFEGIMEEAQTLATLDENLFIKIPMTKDGLRAIKALCAKGLRITATAIFSASQAFLAGKAGARYVAPYVNRMDNISAEGVHAVADIVSVLRDQGFATKVLAASFSNAQQVIDVIRLGADCVTIPPHVADSLLNHPLTDLCVDKFVTDFEAVFGKGATALTR